jgi:DNA-binding LytR/AlgR family response regulator
MPSIHQGGTIMTVINCLLLLYNLIAGFIIGIYYIKSDALRLPLREKNVPCELPPLPIKAVTDGEKDNKMILLSGKTKEAVMLDPANLIYMEASKNYVEIYFQENEKVSRRTLRTTIHQLEETLKDYPSIIRCHRAFIVNTACIKGKSSNRQGCLLTLKSVDKEIPVSRTYKKQIMKK